MKNKTDIWHVFTNGHDEYFTPAEGGEKAARAYFEKCKKTTDAARLYFRAAGQDEENDGDCIESYGGFPF
jgi:Tfp pilus assembly protein PilF